MHVNLINHNASCIMIMYLFFSKLLGGGIESMAITEAFGGKITFIAKNIHAIEDCLKSANITLSYRVPHRQDPAVSHPLW